MKNIYADTIYTLFRDYCSPVVRAIIIILTFSLLSLQIALGEEKSYHTIVFNGERSAMELSHPWARALTLREIYNWSRSRRFSLIADRPPVVDGRAFYVSKFGSAINIADLKKDRTYRMWIDFVTFHEAPTSGIQSRLEIFVDRELITVLNFGDITEENNPYRIDIPYDCSIDGSVTIRFQEYSPSGGFWGIWDIVVSESVEMPKVITREDVEKSKKRMQPKEKLLESDKKPRKRRTTAEKKAPTEKVKRPEEKKRRKARDVEKKEKLEKPLPGEEVKDVDKKEPVKKKEPKKEQMEKPPPQEKVKDDTKELLEKKEQKREEKKEEKKEEKDKQIKTPETIGEKDKSVKKPVEKKKEPEKEQKMEEKGKEDIRMERKDEEKDTGNDKSMDSADKESKKSEN